MKKLLTIILSFTLIFTACTKAPAAPTWQEQYDLGVRYLSEGNYQEAILAFTAAIEIDPKKADAYLGLADVYVAAGDTDAARDILRRGYEATGDERLKEIEQPKQEQTAVPDGPPEELTVLVSEHVYWREVENGVYLDARLVETYTFAYDENGYLIRSECERTWAPGNPHVSVQTCEYNEATGLWHNVYSSKDSGEVIVEGEIELQRGIGQHLMGVQNICTAPYSYNLGGGFHATTVQNPDFASYESVDGEENWAYAEYEYDNAGNAVKLVSFTAGGEITGYCLLEWAVLKLGPDGIYTMQ